MLVVLLFTCCQICFITHIYFYLYIHLCIYVCMYVLLVFHAALAAFIKCIACRHLNAIKRCLSTDGS